MILTAISMKQVTIWLSSPQTMQRKNLLRLQDYFDYTVEKRLIFIIYNKTAEYKQSNIGLVTSDQETYNTGGYSRIIKNKVMLYYEGDHEDL